MIWFEHRVRWNTSKQWFHCIINFCFKVTEVHLAKNIMSCNCFLNAMWAGSDGKEMLDGSTGYYIISFWLPVRTCMHCNRCCIKIGRSWIPWREIEWDKIEQARQMPPTKMLNSRASLEFKDKFDSSKIQSNFFHENCDSIITTIMTITTVCINDA